jgi:hypothetical protein
MLINIFHKNQSDKSEQEYARIYQAETFIESLPDKDKRLVENYIDSLISQLAIKKLFFLSVDF